MRDRYDLKAGAAVWVRGLGQGVIVDLTSKEARIKFKIGLSMWVKWEKVILLQD